MLQRAKTLLRSLPSQQMKNQFFLTKKLEEPQRTWEFPHIFNREEKFADPMDDCVKAGKRYFVGGWLLAAAGGVYFMVLLGGYTRLTGSGLSMTKWKPIDTHYPRNEVQWETEFDNYKLSHEYKHSNVNLERFKSIFFLEWAHRLSGSTLGAIYVLPLITFRLLGWIKPKFARRLYLIGCFGLSQGLIGWWMVKSGLNQPKPIYQTRPRVSTYRLCVHLGMACSIYSMLMWNALNVLRAPQHQIITPENVKAVMSIRRLSIILLGFVAFNIYSGAMMAGIDAGKVYNTWPDINGQFFPAGMYKLSPFYKNFFENVACVQFNHRNAAYLTYVLTALIAYKTYGVNAPTQVKLACLLLITAVNYQLYSGITTLMSNAPIHSCQIHQFNGLNVLTATIILINFSKRPSPIYRSYLKSLKM